MCIYPCTICASNSWETFPATELKFGGILYSHWYSKTIVLTVHCGTIGMTCVSTGVKLKNVVTFPLLNIFQKSYWFLHWTSIVYHLIQPENKKI